MLKIIIIKTPSLIPSLLNVNLCRYIQGCKPIQLLLVYVAIINNCILPYPVSNGIYSKYMVYFWLMRSTAQCIHCLSRTSLLSYPLPSNEKKKCKLHCMTTLNQKICIHTDYSNWTPNFEEPPSTPLNWPILYMDK